MAMVLTSFMVCMAALCVEAAAVGVRGTSKYDAEQYVHPQACRSYLQRESTPTKYLFHGTP